MWLMSWSLFGVLLFLRDAPAESNDVSTIPNQTADADTCSLAWAETATTPKHRKLRPGSTNKNKPASKPKRLGFIVCLGHVFVCVVPEETSHPKRLKPRRRHLQPRMLGRNSPDAETARIAPRRQKTNQPRSRNGLGSTTAKLFTYASSSRSNDFSLPPA